jgi:hypothetical protein
MFGNVKIEALKGQRQRRLLPRLKPRVSAAYSASDKGAEHEALVSALRELGVEGLAGGAL